MNCVIIGVGLIGGSLGLALQRTGFTHRIIGVDRNPRHAEEALRRGLVDEMQDLDTALPSADLVVIAIPVHATARILPHVLGHISPGAVVTDMGSTKESICGVVAGHPRRGRYVAAHPIAGTEHSGPAAALEGLFTGKLSILCNVRESDPDAVHFVRKLFRVLGMRLLEMDADAHDRHAAYVSHISHISSFVLAATVLEIEKNTSTIFDLAGSGFESTVRLAKSSPAMWAPIFDQNRQHVCEALDAYIRNIAAFRDMVAEGNMEALTHTMAHANEIRRVLAGINHEPASPPNTPTP